MSVPLVGLKMVGADSSIPAIGPAMDGLSGFRLFSASHATELARNSPRVIILSGMLSGLSMVALVGAVLKGFGVTVPSQDMFRLLQVNRIGLRSRQEQNVKKPQSIVGKVCRVSCYKLNV